MNEAIQLYLSGRRDTGVLLSGQLGLPLLEDAYYLACELLSTTKDRLSIHPDFLFVDRGKDKSIGVEKVEEILSKGSLKPSISNKILILIDAIDTMTEQAQNKLLKLLEDSEHVLLVATSYSNNVLHTIKSRMRIISYHPYTKDDFYNYCNRNNISNPEMLFYVTGGCPGLIDSYSGAAKIMKQVVDSFNKEKPLEILSVLHLVKENDRDNFFSVYPQLVGNLYRLIGRLCADAIHNSAPYNKKQLLTVMKLVNDGLLECDSRNYTKNSFFISMILIIEALS